MSWKQLEEISQWMAVGWSKLNHKELWSLEGRGRLYMESDFDKPETTPRIPVMEPNCDWLVQVLFVAPHYILPFCWILLTSQFRLKLWVSCSAAARAQGIHVHLRVMNCYWQLILFCAKAQRSRQMGSVTISTKYLKSSFIYWYCRWKGEVNACPECLHPPEFVERTFWCLANCRTML